MEDNKKKLYDALSADYDMGSFEQFSKDIQDSAKRQKLYDTIKEEYDLPDFEGFTNQLGITKAKPAKPYNPADDTLGAGIGASLGKAMAQPQKTPTPKKQTQQPTQQPQVAQPQTTQPQPTQLPEGFGQFDFRQANQMGMGRGPVPFNQPSPDATISAHTGNGKPKKQEDIAQKTRRILSGKGTPEENQQVRKTMQQVQDQLEYQQQTGKNLGDDMVKNFQWEAPTIARDDEGNIQYDEQGKPLVGMTTDPERVERYQQDVRDRERAKLVYPLVDDIQKQLEGKVPDFTSPIAGMPNGPQWNAMMNQTEQLRRMNEADSPEKLWDSLNEYFGLGKKSDIDDEELRKQGKSVVLAHWDEKDNGEDFTSKFLTDNQDAIQQAAARSGMDTESFVWNELIPKISETIAERFNQNMSEKYSVKNTADYIAKRMINSSVGALARMGTMTPQQSQFMQEGLERSNLGEGQHFNAEWYHKLGGKVAEFLPDGPLMMIGGAAGGAAAKTLGATIKALGAESLGTLVASGSPFLAANVGKLTKWSGLLGHAITSSAANMGTFMGMSSALQAMASTPVDDGYLSSIGMAGWKGMKEGAKIGTALGVLGQLSGAGRELWKTPAGRAAWAGGSFLAENQIFALSDYLADPEKFNWVDSSLDALYMQMAGKVQGLTSHGADGVKNSFKHIFEPMPKMPSLTEAEKAQIQRAFGGLSFDEIAGDMRNLEKILSDKENIPYTIRQKISGRVLGAFEPNRPYTYKTNIRGNEIYERAKDGELINIHTFESPDERDAIMQDISDRKQHDQIAHDFIALDMKEQAAPILESFAKEFGLTNEELWKIMNKKPVELVDDEYDLMTELGRRLHDAANPKGELHSEQSNTDGAEMAGDSAEMNPETAASIAQELAEAKEAYDNFPLSDDLRMKVQSLGDNARLDDIYMYVRDNFSGPEADAYLKVVADYANAKAKQQGYISKTADNIEDQVAQDVSEKSFHGLIDGGNDIDNIITITRDGEELIVLNGNIVTRDGVAVNPELSGDMIIARTKDGRWVSMKPDALMTISNKEPKDAYANRVREEFQVKDTETAINTGLVQPEEPKPAVAENGGENVGGEAGAENGTGANEPPATAISKIPTLNDENGQPIKDEEGDVQYQFEQAPLEDTLAALAEINHGDRKRVTDSVDAMIKVSEKGVKDAEKMKPKSSDPIKMARELDQIEAQKAEAQKKVDYWTRAKQELEKVKEPETNLNVEPVENNEPEKSVSLQPKAASEQEEGEKKPSLKSRLQQLAERYKKKYGAYFNDDIEVPGDATELVALNIGTGRQFRWDDKPNGVGGVIRGFKTALGINTEFGGRKGSEGHAFAHLFKGRDDTSGLGFDEFVDKVWRSDENTIHGLDGNDTKRFTEQQIGDAIIDLFMSAESGKDITEYVLRNRVEKAKIDWEAEQARLREEAARNEKIEYTDEELQQINKGLPFEKSTNEDIPDAPITKLQKEADALMKEENTPEIAVYDTDRISNEGWRKLAEKANDGAFLSEEDVEEFKKQALEGGVFYNEESGKITVFSGDLTPEELRLRINEIKKYIEDESIKDEEGQGPRDSVDGVQEGEGREGSSETGESRPSERTTEPESERKSESSERDEYLNPRDEEEKKIIEQVNNQLQQDIQAAVDEVNKARSELQKAQAKESDRATDLFGNDNALNKEGQLFDNSDMPVDQTLEGVERRTSAQREKLQEAQNKLNKLQSPEERNSRIRGALDNKRRQTSFDEIDERHKREYEQYIKPLLDKSDEELQRLKKAKEDAVGGDLTKLEGDKEWNAIHLVLTQREADKLTENNNTKGKVKVEKNKNGETEYTTKQGNQAFVVTEHNKNNLILLDRNLILTGEETKEGSAELYEELGKLGEWKQGINRPGKNENQSGWIIPKDKAEELDRILREHLEKLPKKGEPRYNPNPIEAIEKSANEFREEEKEKRREIGITTDETPEQVAKTEGNEVLNDPTPLTEDEINNSSLSNVQKTWAKAYLKGNTDNELYLEAYLEAYDDVRNKGRDSETNRSDADRTQLVGTDDSEEQGSGQPGRQTGELASGVDVSGQELERSETERVQRSEDSKDNVSVSSGEGSDSGVPESESKLDGVSSGGERPTGGSSTRSGGRDVRSTGASDGSSRVAGQTGERDVKTRRNDLKNKRDELLAKLKELKDKEKKDDAGKLQMAILPPLPSGISDYIPKDKEQRKVFWELATTTAEYGYTYLEEGITKFNEWKNKIYEDFVKPIKDFFSWGDNEVDRYIQQVWNSEYEINGVTRTMSEWASFLGEENLKKVVASDRGTKYEQQQAAESIDVKTGDIDNIRETLPYLLPEQQDDVLKAETQFFDESHQNREHGNGKGMMFTNGTGTGKTYTGLGIVKRFVRQGKGRVLILTPSQEKVRDWAADGQNLGLEIEKLDDVAKATGTTATKSKGKGVVVTTYANARQNLAMLEDCFDLIVYDESHKIAENKEGERTTMTDFHEMLTNKNVEKSIDRQTYWLPEWIEHRNLIKESADTRERLDELSDYDDNEKVKVDGNEIAAGDLKAKLNARMVEIQKRLEELRPIMEEIRESKRPQAEIDSKRTKTVFLSATPFNVRESLGYAEGYLFSYPEEDKTTVGTYNHRTPRDAFYEQMFPAGYRWRYGRLENHVANAEALGRQEIDFSDYLQNTLHTLSGRMIASDYDYSRDFPIMTLDNAGRFNQAMSEVYRNKRYQPLADIMRQIWNYNDATSLFEAMKTSLVNERIKEHLARGQKVVVFHRRRTSKDIALPFHRAMDAARAQAASEQDGNTKQKLLQAVHDFEEDFKDIFKWEETIDYTLPREQIERRFGKDRVAFFSGAESKNVKHKSVEDFMKDNGGKDIIVIQEASGKEGISLHDQTGEHQRVEINLALPQSPIAFIQIEGRIYRIGQKSNAIFEYPLLGLDLETNLFAQKFNNALGTTENLALGSKARNLRKSIANSVLENTGEVEYDRQGLGGKDMDGRVSDTGDKNGFDIAIQDYYGNQKMAKGRDNREGYDYFPTPEPIGYKMVEFGQIGEGETALEPSAGHGAIARYVPEANGMTAIEPSANLFTKLQMRAGGPGRRFEEMPFEDYPLSNKHDVILMNPPYGVQGKMAMEHVAKAFRHLNEGGRIVAIIPDGPAMERRFDAWINSTGADGLNGAAVVVGEVRLPDVAFGRAGTNVRTRIVVIDKVTRPEMRRNMPQKVSVDLSGEGAIGGLFDKIRNIRMPERTIDQVAINEKRAKRTERQMNDNPFVNNFHVGQIFGNKNVLKVSTRADGTSLDINIDLARISEDEILDKYESLKNTLEHPEKLDFGRWVKKSFGSGKNKISAIEAIKDYCETAIKTLENVSRMTADQMDKRLKEVREEAERRRQEQEAQWKQDRERREKERIEKFKQAKETMMQELGDRDGKEWIEGQMDDAWSEFGTLSIPARRRLQNLGIDWETGHVTKREEPAKPQTQPSQVKPDYEYALDKNTRTGDDMHLVKYNGSRLSDDQYRAVERKAKAQNGYYNRFKKAWHFNTEADARKFAESLNGTTTEEGTTRMRLREKPAPKNTKKVFKLMRLGDDGKLYPLFIDSASPTELGKWYDADSPDVKNLEGLEPGFAYKIDKDGNVVDTKPVNRTKTTITGLPNVQKINDATNEESRWITVTTDKKGAKTYHNVGINGSGQPGTFAMRPGWHAGSLPSMRQIGKGKDRNLRDDRFVWVEGEVPADVDYQEEANGNPFKDIPTHIPEDGYYMKATNANKEASQADRIGWYVAGAFKANRIMSDVEARNVITKWNKEHPDQPVEYDFDRESGKDFNAETMQLEDRPTTRFRSREADEDGRFDFDKPIRIKEKGISKDLKDIKANKWNLPEKIKNIVAEKLEKYMSDKDGDIQDVDVKPYFGGKGETTAKDALEYISNNSTDNGIKELASYLLKNIGDNGDVSVKFSENRTGSRGKYYSNNHSVSIRRAAARGVDEATAKNNLEQTIIHEIAHAITVRAIENSPEVRKEFLQIYKDYEELREQYGINTGYAAKNPKEFVAEFLGRKAFREALMEIPSNEKGKTFGQKVLDFIKKHILRIKETDTFFKQADDAIKKVMDMANKGDYPYVDEVEEDALTRFRFAKDKDDFDRIREDAIKSKGLVVKGLGEAEVKVTNVPKHDFVGTGKQAIKAAREWAKKNLIGEHKGIDSSGEEFTYHIDNEAIGKYLSKSSTGNSDNLGVHLAVLKELPSVIENSIEAEIHPDYLKDEVEGRSSNSVIGEDELVHRFYGAAEIDGKVYRVKTTILEKREDGKSKPHDYKVTKVDVILDGGSSTSNAPRTSTIAGAKLLENVEKSYDSGKKLLDESEKSTFFRSKSSENNPVDVDFSQKEEAGRKLAKKLNSDFEALTSLDQIQNKEVRDAIAAGNEVPGWIEIGKDGKKKIFMYLPHVKDTYDAEKTIAHETVGHLGLRELLGEKGYKSYCKSLLYDLKDPELQKYWMENLPKNGFDSYRTVDEFLAEAAEKGYGDLSMWQKVRNSLTDALRSVGFTMSPTISDTKYMVWLSKHNLESGNAMNQIQREALLYKLGQEVYEAKVRNGEFGYGEEAPSNSVYVGGGAPYYPGSGKTLFRHTPSVKNQRLNYERSLKRIGYVWKEAHVDAMQAAVELMRSISGVKKIEDIPSAENFVLLENQMSSKEEQMDFLFNRDYMEPLDDAVSQCLPDMGRGVDEQLRNLQVYMIKKHGLERNRVLYVRDFIRDLRNDSSADQAQVDDLERDYNDTMLSLRDDLRNGTIDLREYFDEVDTWIKKNLDPSYEAGIKDYSGLTHFAGGWDELSDRVMVDDVMSTEAMLGDKRVNNLWEKTKAVSQFGLDMEYEGGLDSKDKHDKVSQMFEWYVPLRGYDEKTAEEVYDYLEEGGSDRKWAGPVLMNAKGRKSLSDVDVFASLGATSSNAINRSLRNQMKQAFARFVRDHYNDVDADKRLVTELPYLWAEKQFDPITGADVWVEKFPDIPENAKADDIAAILDQYQQDMKAKEASGDAKRVRQNSNIPFRPAKPEHKSQHIVDVWINGEKHQFVVNGNPRAAQAINGQLKAERNSNILWLSSLSHFMAKMNTSYSPDFIMRNTERDLIYSAANIAVKENFKYWATWAKNYAVATGRVAAGVPGAHTNLFKRYRDGKLNMANTTDRYFKEFMENGGETGFVEQKNLDKWKKLIKKGVRQESNPEKVGKAVINALPDVIEAMNERAENMARFATYMTSREMGRSITRSVSDAKEVSVNFNRKGAGKKTVGLNRGDNNWLSNANAYMAGWTAQNLQDYIMFYNAGVQGVTNMVKSVTNNPIKGTTAFALFAMAGMLMPQLNNYLADEDDDKDGKVPENPYAELPEYVRRNNLCIYANNGSFITIALPIELRAMYGIGDMAASYINHPELRSTKNAGVDIVSQLSQVMPLDFLGEGAGPMWAVVPSGVRPFAEAAANTNWLGQPIERDEERWNENKPRWTRAFKNVGDVYVGASKRLNAATNPYGDENIKGWADGAITDPALVEHIVNGYFGGVGSTTNRVAQLVKHANEMSPKEAITSNWMPIVRTQHYSPNERTRYARTRNKWWYYKEEADKTKETINALKKRGETDPLAYMESISEEEGRKGDRANIMDKAYKRYNKIKKKLEKTDDLQEKDLYQLQMDQIMEETVKELDKIQ